MKKLFRGLVVGLFLLFAWPFFLYKRYGNRAYRPDGNTLIVSNHYSTLDAFFIYLLYGRRRIYFVTIINVKEKCLSRFVTWLFDCLYLDYEKTNFNFFKQCASILKEGGIVCIYPEGEINLLKFGFFEFKRSFIFIAKRAGAKILPVFIYPDYMPFRRTKLYIGDVLLPEDYGKYEDLGEAATFVQSKIMEYSLLVGKTKPPLEVTAMLPPELTENMGEKNDKKAER